MNSLIWLLEQCVKAWFTLKKMWLGVPPQSATSIVDDVQQTVVAYNEKMDILFGGNFELIFNGYVAFGPGIPSLDPVGACMCSVAGVKIVYEIIVNMFIFKAAHVDVWLLPLEAHMPISSRLQMLSSEDLKNVHALLYKLLAWYEEKGLITSDRNNFVYVILEHCSSLEHKVKYLECIYSVEKGGPLGPLRF